MRLLKYREKSVYLSNLKGGNVLGGGDGTIGNWNL